MSEEHRLGYGTESADIREHVQLVFGHLVRMATPVLTAYWSDLYHDATWLQKHMAGDSFTFYYAYDEAGTSIGTDPVVADTREHAYRLEAFVTGRTVMLGITDLKVSDS